ncbi:hypothetical protein FMM68_03340 [Lachnospiraceae bacterium MD329]|nr:hypothetical protein [Lachnospiraceae bacterium MD329]
MDIYKQIHTSDEMFYLYTGIKEEDLYTYDYQKEPFEFLIDAYNSNLENSRQKFAKQLFQKSYKDMNIAKHMNCDYHLIDYDEAYKSLGLFMNLSNEDYKFIKALMFLMTDDEFSSSKVLNRLYNLFDGNDITMELDFIDKSMSEVSQRLGLLSYMFSVKWAVYDDCFSDNVCACINELRQYNINDKLSFNARIETSNQVYKRFFGYTFNTMMDEILFEIYCFINDNATIKQCKNCGKLFQPLRTDALYCDNISPQEETKTCKEYGAYQQWRANTQSNEVTKLYRKIYMRKQMQAKRNPDIKMYVDDFENYKKQTKKWKENIKKGKKTNDEFLTWLKDLK